MDDKDIMLAVRKAVRPFIEGTLAQELASAIAKVVAEELAKAMNSSTLKVEIDTKMLDKHIADFLEKRDVPPIIVKPADINIPPINFGPVVTAIEKAAEPIAIEAPEVPEPIGDYRPHDQDTGGKVYKYYGFASTKGNWYIMRQASNEQRYAAGKGNYADAWEKREKQDFGLIEGKLNG